MGRKNWLRVASMARLAMRDSGVAACCDMHAARCCHAATPARCLQGTPNTSDCACLYHAHLSSIGFSHGMADSRSDAKLREQQQDELGLAGRPYRTSHTQISITGITQASQTMLASRYAAHRQDEEANHTASLALDPHSSSACCNAARHGCCQLPAKLCCGKLGCDSQPSNLVTSPTTTGLWSFMWVGNSYHPAVGTKLMKTVCSAELLAPGARDRTNDVTRQL
jgi:hypothetical protein